MGDRKCGDWWLTHVRETYRYAMGLYAKKPEEQRIAVEHLIEGTVEWGRLLKLPEGADLMRAHVLATKNVADGAFSWNKGMVDQAVDSLLVNARAQADFYAAKIPRFPSKAWSDLFTAHIAATGAYILALAARDHADFGRQFSKVEENRAELMGFWNVACWA